MEGDEDEDGGSWRARETAKDTPGPAGPDGRLMRYWHGGRCDVEVEAGGWHVYMIIELSLSLPLSLSLGGRVR